MNKKIIYFIIISLICLLITGCIDQSNENDKTKKTAIESDDENKLIEEINNSGYFNDCAGNKFNKYISSEHFDIFYNSVNESSKIYAEGVVKELEKNYYEIINYFDLDEGNISNISINLYPTYKEFKQSIFKEIKFNLDYIDNCKGFSLSKNKFYITYDKNRYVNLGAVHEFVHCLTYKIASVETIPSWLFEGVAMYLSQDEDYHKDEYPEFIKKGLPEEYILNDYTNRYIYGYSMVEYIIEIYGREKLIELLKEYGDLKKVLNVTENEFRNGWTKFLEDKVKKNQN